MPTLHTFRHVEEEEETLPYLFHKVSRTLILNPEKYFTKEEKKILNKILANQIQQQCIKRIRYHDQVRFVPGMQGLFTTQKIINIIHQINRI